MTQITTVVFSHLQPDILECEVKWALGSITMNKACVGDGIPVELFQILKDDAGKVLHYSSKFGKLSSGHRIVKSQFSFKSQRRVKPKKCSNYNTIALISHTSKVMLKILQARLQQNMNMNFQMFKLVLEKTEEPEIKLPTSAGSSKKQESSRKTSISALFLLCQSL